MADPKTTLGAACLKRGQFYVCKDKPIRFIGCCTIDPCQTSDGACPDGNLQPTTFDDSAYSKIGPQNCTSSQAEWYTCAMTSPRFMGCCTENPCSIGSCPADSLRGAKLSSKADDAEVFLTGATSTVSSSRTASTTMSTAVSTTMSTGAGAPTADGSQDSVPNHKGLSNGAVAGIAVGSTVGGLVVLAALGFALFRWARKTRQAQPPSKPTYQVCPAQSEGQFPQYSPSTSPLFSQGMQTSNPGSPGYSHSPPSYTTSTQPYFHHSAQPPAAELLADTSQRAGSGSPNTEALGHAQGAHGEWARESQVSNLTVATHPPRQTRPAELEQP